MEDEVKNWAVYKKSCMKRIWSKFVSTKRGKWIYHCKQICVNLRKLLNQLSSKMSN